MTTITSTQSPPAHATRAGAHTTGSLAAAVSAELIGPADLPITGVEALDRAGPGMLTFIRSEKYAHAWAGSKAAAALVTRGLKVPGHDPASRALLVVEDADLAMIVLLPLFAPGAPAAAPGVHPTAVVDPSARVEPGASVGPYCVIGAGASVAAGSVLHPHVVLGAGARVGRGTVLYPHVSVLDRCVVGDGCILWHGVRIGADGFGYRPDPGGRGLVKIPHIGHVEVGNGVEIGANSCIDRGKFGATTIGDGTKIDNLVQIAHNCRIGRSVIICGVTGIAGSATIGDGVVIAGHVGVADGVTIGARATVSAKSGVICDVPAGETWGGFPAAPHKEMMRSFAALRRLPDHLRAIKRLEREGRAE